MHINIDYLGIPVGHKTNIGKNKWMLHELFKIK